MLWLAALTLLMAPEPQPIPTGLDLLYGDRMPLGADGEPRIAIGLARGERRLDIVTDRARLDFFQDGVLRSAQPRRGARIRIAVTESQPATRRFHVDVGGVAFNDEAKLAEAVRDWERKGFKPEVLQKGSAVGIRGRMIDTRHLRIVLPAKTRRAAGALAERVHRTTGARPTVDSRLLTLPWASLRVTIDGAPIGNATSYVRITAVDNKTLKVEKLRFGRGFSHSGREDRSYRGELYAVVDADGKLALVNVLGSEDLLRGVVPSELFASAHPDALKAQSVAARNQLFAKLGHRHHSDPFHLCSEQHCQVYTGVNREDPRTDAAIAATRGQLLFRRGRLVDTVYSSTCGGHTENNDTVWGNVADPALRGRPDFDVTAQPELASFVDGIDEHEMDRWVSKAPQTYCSQASKVAAHKFRWTRRFEREAIEAVVKKRFPAIGELEDIRVAKRGPGGRVEVLELIGTRSTHRLLHELAIRRAFNHLNSGSFTVKQSPDGSVTFRGGGWGHGVGMCQLGAIGRAESGHSYRHILRHYYNGARTEQIYGQTFSGGAQESMTAGSVRGTSRQSGDL